MLIVQNNLRLISIADMTTDTHTNTHTYIWQLRAAKDLATMMQFAELNFPMARERPDYSRS